MKEEDSFTARCMILFHWTSNWAKRCGREWPAGWSLWGPRAVCWTLLLVGGIQVVVVITSIPAADVLYSTPDLQALVPAAGFYVFCRFFSSIFSLRRCFTTPELNPSQILTNQPQIVLTSFISAVVPDKSWWSFLLPAVLQVHLAFFQSSVRLRGDPWGAADETPSDGGPAVV